MKQIFLKRFHLFFFLVVYTVTCTANSITKDDSSGNYIVIYQGTDNGGQPVVHTVTFVPATKINPLVKSEYSFAGKTRIKYKYTVRNKAGAEQKITGLHFEGVKVNQQDMIAPPGWHPVSAKISSLEHSTGWLAVAAQTSDKKIAEPGISPGKTEKKFGFIAEYLPGILLLKLKGEAPILEFPDEGPTGDLAQELARLESNNYVSVPIAAPLIYMRSSNTQIIKKLKSQLEALISYDYLSKDLGNELAASLGIAKNAVESTDTGSALSALKQAVHLLENEHEDTEENEGERKEKDVEDEVRSKVNKKAAQVLKFNLKYLIAQFEK